MRKTIILAAMVLLTAGRLSASDQTDVMGAVNQLLDAFNKGDAKKVMAVCTDDMCIIDDFPPYEWHGPGTCAKWLADYDADAKQNGITDGAVTLGKPRHVDVTPDRAYVVVPAKHTCKRHGDPVKERGNTWTLTLQKGDSGWRITGWAWGKH